MILELQFIVGGIQVVIAFILTIINVVKKSRPKSLGNYWMAVFVYFIVLFLLGSVAPDIAWIWFFSAWGIAIYWFMKIPEWLKKI